MQPCLTLVSGAVTVDTRRFSDGPHTLGHCATDFAGNVGCASSHTILIDNNPPAHPRSVTLAGRGGWRAANDFDLTWTNPDQGPASPIWGAYWRITGPAGHDSGVALAHGRGVAALPDRRLPRPGAYTLHLWLRDEAGNDAPATAVEVPLRFDDVAPGVAFDPTEGGPGAEPPEVVRATVTDAHSGPAGGEIRFRRLESDRWFELPTKTTRGPGSETAALVARLPGDLAPGLYLFRAEASDAAGNRSSSTRRADGTEMAIRKLAVAAARRGPARRTRLYARIRWGRRSGSEVTVPFGAAAALAGRLVSAEGAGLEGRSLRVVSRPSRGALARRRVDSIRTGPHGGFRLRLAPGTSRRVTVSFAGEAGLSGSRRPSLALRVRGGIGLAAAPLDADAGSTVRFWGRVRARGAPLPRRGKLVAIQYYEAEARRWRPVMVVRSDHGGRFQARYRFRYVSGTARIQLRAVALAEERWPYAPGASRPVLVQVSG
jgi:hypothetical protein